MGLSPLRDGAPYCEKDYQVHFGVQCEACHQFITGKVLEVRHTLTHLLSAICLANYNIPPPLYVLL